MMATTSQNCDEDIIDSWSTQATQGSDSEEENNARIDRQPSARYPISEADFLEFFKLENQRHRRYLDHARKYRVENPADFCATCRLNVKYTQLLLATFAYEALVITKHNCNICGSKEGNCDSLKHRDYHEENCLKLQ
jgi:hypothetical protein